jgi:hypothetical protein
MIANKIVLIKSLCNNIDIAPKFHMNLTSFKRTPVIVLIGNQNGNYACF